ncbi:MAG: non-ribosomal peptide synthetase, partial [Rubrivivax sp.]
VEAELVALIQHCVNGAGGVSPSDFPKASLDAAALDHLVAHIVQTGRSPRDIEDIYPLTPMQQSMVADAALDPASLVNVVQTHALFDRFDLDRLQQAWQTVMARHAVLRTGFFWQGLAEPVQVVFRGVDLVIEHRDWQGRATAMQEWQALCEHEYQQGFDLARAPLMRLVVARMDGQHDRLVWTWHHVLLDGWSMSRLLGEVFTLYGGGTLGRQGPAFAEHVTASRAGRADDEAFWRGVLAGSQPGTLLAGAPRTGATQRGHAAESQRLDASATRRLQAFATAQHVTMNTLVQGAWAQVLAAHTGQRAVAFGATVSGRSGDTERIDEIMGLCINNLPVRVGLDPAQPVGDWLRGLLDHNMALRQREHTPMADLQRWAGQSGQPLFDTLIIFENYPVDQALTRGAGAALQVHELVNRGATSTPLTLVVIPGEQLLVTFEYARAAFDGPVVADLLRQFMATLQTLPDDPGRRLDQVRVPVPLIDLPRRPPEAPSASASASAASATAATAATPSKDEPAASTSPVLYALPARAWHADEYASLLAALEGRHEAVTLACNPEQEIAWAGTSLQALAARHAAFIRAHAAGRPCCLLGWSVGGLLALETARQLNASASSPVAWVGLVDPSGFPVLRGLLAQGRPLLDASQRAALEDVLARWLTGRSGMSGHWYALLAAMQPIEREAFLAQVVAAHGADGEHLPTDGPGHGSAEHALWSEMNCLRLGASHPLPEAAACPVRIWQSGAAIEGLADIVARCLGTDAAIDDADGRCVTVPATDHLSVLEAPAFHRGVCEALDAVVRS